MYAIWPIAFWNLLTEFYLSMSNHSTLDILRTIHPCNNKASGKPIQRFL